MKLRDNGGIGPAPKRQKAQEGFTLVEMAIVLVIIGLIVGGILKGEEIVNNGRVKTQVAQIDSIKAAVSTFQDEFGFYPGDFKASTSLTKSTAFDGDENGIVGTAGSTLIPADTAGVGNEMSYAWIQMTLANLLGGANIGTAAGAVAQFPGKIPGSFLFFGDFQYISTNPNAAGSGGGNATFINKFVRIQANPDTNSPVAVMRVLDAQQIDTKYDDGVPSTGTILANNAANCCSNGDCHSATTYASAGGATTTGLFCNLLWQAQ